ncbi:MAG TPA: Arc family DNA-binding protein [Thermomicrobiales bacterium]|jgi:hypothetical protein
MPETVRLVLRLPEGVHEAIKAIAEREHRSLNGEIVYILERYAQEERARVEREAQTEGKEAA